MVLKVIEHGQHKDICIKEGEMFVLPGFIPHSPQRFENTIGLVIERDRLPEEKDGLMWFKKDSAERIYAEYFHCTNLGVQLVPVIDRFQHSNACKTGEPDPNTKIPPLIQPNPAQSTDPPIPYASYSSAHPGVTEPFHKGEFKISLVNATDKAIALPERCEPGEIFYYQRSGHSTLHMNGHSVPLAPHAVFLVPHSTKVKSDVRRRSILSLFISSLTCSFSL
jgi:3-hydroxyanthranilate 3,4-dioxygenase